MENFGKRWTDIIFEEDSQPLNTEQIHAEKTLIENSFEEDGDFISFETQEINWSINKLNKIEVWDILILKFEKYWKEKSINFILKFYITRSYSHKIVWYYFIENLIEKQKSEVVYGEIKYIKAKYVAEKWWKKLSRKILEDPNSITDWLINWLKVYINEALLEKITILKPKQNVKTLTKTVSTFIWKLLKNRWN